MSEDWSAPALVETSDPSQKHKSNVLVFVNSATWILFFDRSTDILVLDCVYLLSLRELNFVNGIILKGLVENSSFQTQSIQNLPVIFIAFSLSYSIDFLPKLLRLRSPEGAYLHKSADS